MLSFNLCIEVPMETTQHVANDKHCNNLVMHFGMTLCLCI